MHAFLFIFSPYVSRLPLFSCLQVLHDYCCTFDFHGLKIDQALRKFLDEFMLPKEAQQISRVMEAFSAQFFAHSPGPLVNADAAFVLAFSVIMLNTDAHNPMVSRKMTVDEFIRNNRGINDKADLPREFLEDLFNSITTNEIKIIAADLKSVHQDGTSAAVLQWVRLFSL